MKKNVTSRKKEKGLPFLNPDLPLEDRIEDLIGRLTVEEKCSQLRYNAPAIDRLGIPAYNWWNEALHGVGRNGRATVFPQAIGLAATWDAELIERIAAAIADEARAKHHAAARRGARGQYQGLTFWSPNVNIFRDPRWGRGQETWGEDPFLTGELGAAFVRGLQGHDPKYLKVAACAKHYAVHSGPEGQRHTFDARPPLKDFRETYLPAFQRLVEEGVESVMGAYNCVYGEPCNGSKLLLEDILRGEWGFQGHVVSDCWAIRDFHVHHGVTKSAEESAALAIRRGCDLNCGNTYCDALVGAVLAGLCTEADVDRALRRLLRTRIRLGLFDPPERVPYASTSMRVVRCAKHVRLAREAAAASIVLLKNDSSALPLPARAGRLFVTGPFAADLNVLLGNYYGLSDRMCTLLEGITDHLPEGTAIDYRMGCPPSEPPKSPVNWAIGEAASADTVIAAMGISPLMEGEEGESPLAANHGDRDRIELPVHQVEFLWRIREKQAGMKKRLVVVLFGGSPLAVPEVQELADAILWVGYPGEAGGAAITDVLFGEVSPSGRLPFTMPRSTDVLPPFDDYAMAGRTYRYMDDASILYPFGFGLSYTRFSYEAAEVSPQVGRDEPLWVAAAVRNSGPRAAHEVVQVYLCGEDEPAPAPRYRLVAFQRVWIEAGETARVEFVIVPRAREYVAADGSRIRAPGRFRLYIGGASPLPASVALGAPAPAEAVFEVAD